MLCSGTKRKLEADGRSHWTECGSWWWGQRETLLQLSLLKLHTPPGHPDPGLMRRVLITNTLRHLQEQHHPGCVAGPELDTIPLDSAAGLRHSDTLIQPVSAPSFPCDFSLDDFCFTELDDFLFERSSSSSPTKQLVKSVTQTSQDLTNLQLNLELNEHDHVTELLFGSRI